MVVFHGTARTSSCQILISRVTRVTTREFPRFSLDDSISTRLSINPWLNDGDGRFNKEDKPYHKLSVSLESRSRQTFSPSSGNEPPLPGDMRDFATNNGASIAVPRGLFAYFRHRNNVTPKSLPLPPEPRPPNRDDENKNCTGKHRELYCSPTYIYSIPTGLIRLWNTMPLIWILFAYSLTWSSARYPRTPLRRFSPVNPCTKNPRIVASNDLNYWKSPV